MLTSLDLSGNGITDSGARALARELARPVSALKELALSDNLIGDGGADALAELLAADLHGAGLTRLSLDSNHVAPRGARCLAAALGANSTLKYLSLAGNGVGDVGARAFAAALGANRSLTHLDLAASHIGADGVAALVAALDAHRSLTDLTLADNVVDADVEQRRVDRLRLNRLAATLPAWAEAAASKRIELPGNRAIPPALAAQIGVLAFGQQLVPTSGWKSADGMTFAKRALLLLAEAELLQSLLSNVD